MELYGTECSLMDGSASVTACKFMAILRTWVSLGNLGYPWVTLGILGQPWVSMGKLGELWETLELAELPIDHGQTDIRT